MFSNIQIQQIQMAKRSRFVLFFIILLIVFFFYKINRIYQLKSYFKGDWIITKLVQDDIDIYNDLLSKNCGIDLNSKIVDWPHFNDSDLTTFDNIQKVDVEIKDNEIYIISHNYDIFKDTFLLKCANFDCCTIYMKSRSLYVELIYNGNYNGIGRGKKCPRADKVLETLFK